MRQTVAVFGGTGFIGRQLCIALAGCGADVRSVSRQAENAPDGVRAVACDIIDQASAIRVVEGADVVINLVGTTRPGGAHSFQAVHVEAPRHLARAARNAGARRFVQVSALGVRRNAPAEADRSKAAGEAVVREMFRGATIVRPSLVYGPDDHFVTRFAAMIRRFGVIPMIGGGLTRFQPVHIDDFVAGVLAVLGAEESEGRVYELGGPRAYTFRDLIGLIGAVLGREPRTPNLSFPSARFLAGALGFLGNPPLTRDEVELLATDKVVAPNAHDLAELGVEPRGFEKGLAEILDQRWAGQPAAV
ncbi:MAG: complex I NDUFA9 subunit family protein [Rhodospirillaceae bacterium]|nr:complex I NDUFA9 subunit family protein [Rhodospirillaceae bacterium]